MAKRKRKRKRAANPPAARRRAKKRSGAHRKRSHNPTHRARAKRRTSHRRRKHNPGHRRAKRRTVHHARRARRANPHHRHTRRSKRRSRRNPGIPSWALAGLAAAAGLGTFALTTSASFGLTKRFDPSLASLERNRYIGGAVATALGLALAIWANPVVGAGVMGGGLAALAGTQLSFLIDPVFQLGASPAAPAPATTKGLGAVYGGGQQQLGAIYGGGQQQLGMGAVFNGQAQMLSGVEDNDYGFGG